MNFTGDVKREIRSLPAATQGCRTAAFRALLDTSGYVSDGRIFFVSENEGIAEYFLRLAEEAFGVRMEVERATFDPKRERDKLTFSCTEEESHSILAALSPPNGEEEALFYLRGAFLGGGSCTLPRGGAKTGYHLEVVFPAMELAEAFCELLEMFQLLAGIVKRGERSVVYLKSREAIEDFFSVIGAEGGISRIERVAAAREESNNENRVINCFQGNADRAAIASAAQAVAFSEMEKEGKLALLPKPLAEAARARLRHPELSLSELAETLGVTKSCLNHRLRKLMQLHGENNE